MNMSGITMQSRNTFGIGEGYAFTMIIMTNIYWKCLHEHMAGSDLGNIYGFFESSQNRCYFSFTAEETESEVSDPSHSIRIWT